MNQLTMFGQNIALLIGILTCLGVGVILFLVVYVAIRASRSARDSKKSLEAYDKARRDPHGRPSPPTGMGVCQQCGRALTDVHYYPDGTRLCRACIDAGTSKG